MLNTNRVIEELVESGVFDFLLVLHFDLQYFPLIHISIPNHVLRQINGCDGIIDFEYLRKNKQVFAIQALFAKIQFNELVKSDFSHGNLSSMHANSLDIVLINELSEVLETESVDDLLLVVLAGVLNQPEINLLQKVIISFQTFFRQDRVLQHLSH